MAHVTNKPHNKHEEHIGRNTALKTAGFSRGNLKEAYVTTAKISGKSAWPLARLWLTLKSDPLE